MHTVRQTSQAAVLRTPGNRAKRSLHFTALEPLLASGAEDGSLYVWDTTTYTLLDSYLQTHSVSTITTLRYTCALPFQLTPCNCCTPSCLFPGILSITASMAFSHSKALSKLTAQSYNQRAWNLLELLEGLLEYEPLASLQTTVSRVCFSPGSPNILISAGLDRSIVLTDRRLDAAIANVPCASPLTALDCKDDGNCITVGNTRKWRPLACILHKKAHVTFYLAILEAASLS